MQQKSVLINEAGNAFFSLKLNKSIGYDEISFTVIKKCFSELCKSPKHVFNLSTETGVFQGKLKIARVSPVYKADDSNGLTNYGPTAFSPMRHKKKILYWIWFSFWPLNRAYYSTISKTRFTILSKIIFIL